jgi:enoyl-CoA hydratase
MPPKGKTTVEPAPAAGPANARPASGSPLRVERNGEVVVWSLARPEARNALDAATFAALERALADAASDPALRAAVLTGDGDVFASGGDLRELRGATTREDAARLSDVGRRVCDAIATLRIPVIAALTGPAIGGGAELAVACDLRVADPKATVCFKHARMAVTTAWGVLPKLVGLVGHGTASRLLLAAHEIDAWEALRLGLVDVVCERRGSVATALAWALDVAQGAPGAVAEIKGLLREASAATADLRARERDRFVATWTSDDHREAVEAYFGSRAPRWR